MFKFLLVHLERDHHANKKSLLDLSFVAVTIFALIYGVSPKWYAAAFLKVTDLNLNVAHILRAIAGLYLALAAFWLYAAFHDKYRDAAIAVGETPKLRQS